MLLKLKAWIYRCTGIYLAHREELAYLKSHAAWKQFFDIEASDDTLTGRDIQGILIGCWQCDHGFYRRLNVFR